MTGALVLVGWALGAPALIRLAPGLPAMQAITAVGFLLTGLALLTRAPRARRIAGIALLAIGGVTSLSFLLDQPLLAAILPFSTFEAGMLRPQRPAPATAVGFCFVGSALLLTLRRRVTTTVPAATLSVLAMGAIGVGALDLSASIATFLGSGAPTGRQMALHTAALFVIAGAALARATRRLSQAGDATPTRRAVAAGAVALLVTLIAAQAIRISQITAAQRATRSVVHALVREIEATPPDILDRRLRGDADAVVRSWIEEAAPGFAITLSAPGLQSVRGGPPAGPADAVFVERAEVTVGSTAAELVVWAGDEVLDQYRRPVGLAVLVLGGTLAVLLTIAVQSAATASARAERLEEALRSLARSETRLHESRKMEAVARMAGGIAHEFNNLLSVIRGYSQLLATEDDEASRRSYVSEIEMASTRGSDLTRRLLTVSARHVLNPEHIPLRAFLAERADVLRRMLGERATLRLDLGGDGNLAVHVDRAQLEQSLMTLAANARDAMPVGGRLTVRTLPRTIDPDTADGIGVRAGRYVELEVSDTGVGIDIERMRSIFEPFRAPPRSGPGAGLGLAMLYGFVRQSGGAVEVRSKSGRGTVFRILLPQADAEPQRVAADRPRAARDAAGLILLVEDEDAVRTLIQRILRRAGYDVVAAVNGRDALGRIAGREDELALLLTDLIMPELDGSALASALREVNPDLPILYMSGYADSEIPTGPEPRDERSAFLHKPFGPGLLLARVDALLPETATVVASNGAGVA